MKKTIMTCIVIGAMSLALTGCGNRKLIGGSKPYSSRYGFTDTTYTYDRAIARFPDGTVVAGKVDNWRDYDGDQIQVTIDGTVYLPHSANVSLIKNKVN